MNKILKRTLTVIAIIFAVLLVIFIALNLMVLLYEYEKTKGLELDDDTIVITEDRFTDYIDEIYLNAEKYEGKTIIIEGVYETSEYNGELCTFVCYKSDSDEHTHDSDDEETHEDEQEIIAMEFICDDPLPEIGTYIHVEGVLSIVEENESAFLVLKNCTVSTI